mgnify:CR=1 FL=1
MERVFDLFEYFVCQHGLRKYSYDGDVRFDFEVRGNGFIVRYLEGRNTELLFVDCFVESQCLYKLVKGEDSGCGLVMVAEGCLTDYLTQLLYADEVIRDSSEDADPLVHRVRMVYEKLRADYDSSLSSFSSWNFHSGTFEGVSVSDFRELLGCFYPRGSRKF